MKIRIFSLIVATTLCLSLFAGCTGTNSSGNDTEGSADASQNTEASGTATSSVDQTLDSMWPISTDGVTFTVFNTKADNEYLENTSDCWLVQQLQELTGVTFEYMDYNSTTGSEKFNLLVAAGDYCDLYRRIEQYYTNSLSTAISDDVILDITTVLDQLPNLQNQIDTNTEVKKRFYNDEGQAPLLVTVYGEMQKCKTGLLVRKDWLDELGISAPTTYDDMYNMLTAFKTQLGATSPYTLNQEGIPRMDCLSAGYGISAVLTIDPQVAYPFYIDNGTVKYGQTQEGFKSLVTMLNKWYSEGLIYQDFYSMTGWDVDTTLLYNNQSGMWIGDNSMIDTYNANGPEATSSADYKVIGISNPIQSADSTDYLNYSSSMTDSGMAIAPQCENLDVLLTYINNMFTDAMSEMISYGVKDYTFTYDADGTPKYTDLITNNPDGLTMNQAKEKYLGSGFAAASIDTSTYINDQYYSTERLEAQTAWSLTGGKYDPYPTLVSMTAEESEEFANIMSDIATYSLEHMIAMITGEEPVSNLDTYIATINEMGIENSIKIKQDAYDRYLAR